MAIGVPRPLALEKPQAVDLAQAARYFGAHGEPDAATLALLQKCAVPLLAAAMPRAVWLLADTPALTDAGLLPGEDVHKHLKGCGQAILLAVTLGPGVDAQIRRAGVGDIAAGVASDALGSALAEQAAEAAEADFDLKFKEHGFPADAPIFAPDLTPDENGLVYVAKILVDAGVAGTASEARRLIDGGGVKVNGEALAPKAYNVAPEVLAGAEVQVGKKKFVRFE